MVQYSIVPNNLLMAEHYMYTNKNSVSPYFGLSQIERTSLRLLKSDYYRAHRYRFYRFFSFE